MNITGGFAGMNGDNTSGAFTQYYNKNQVPTGGLYGFARYTFDASKSWTGEKKVVLNAHAWYT